MSDSLHYTCVRHGLAVSAGLAYMAIQALSLASGMWFYR